MASSQAVRLEAAAKGLYRPDAEHDACGVGFVANIKDMYRTRSLKMLCSSFTILIIAAPSVLIPCAVTVRAF